MHLNPPVASVVCYRSVVVISLFGVACILCFCALCPCFVVYIAVLTGLSGFAFILFGKSMRGSRVGVGDKGSGPPEKSQT